MVLDASQQAIVTESMLQQQIDVLNEDFRNTHGNEPARWADRATDTKIQFTWNTANINRVTTNKTFSANLDDVKYSNQGGSDVVSPPLIMNVWVCKLEGGVLGYAQSIKTTEITLEVCEQGIEESKKQMAEAVANGATLEDFLPQKENV